jgi:hypothetical protein
MKSPKSPGATTRLDGFDIIVNPSVRFWTAFTLDFEFFKERFHNKGFKLSPNGY